MPKLRGRPRDTAVDAAVDTAVESLLLADGYSAVNIDRVAKLARTTRAAVYRRAKTPSELVVGLLVSRFGIDPAPDCGDLRRDLRLLQEIQRRFFADPVVQAALAGLLSDFRSQSEVGGVFYERFMAPRRRSLAAMLARAAERGEPIPVEHSDIAADLLTGPLLLRAAVPVLGPIDDRLLEATVEAALSIGGPVKYDGTGRNKAQGSVERKRPKG
jgi:AcrR family transcriptional regulator